MFAHLLRRRVLARLSTLAVVATALSMAGCATSTESGVRYNKRPTDPIPVQALRVVFEETQYKLPGERPQLSNAEVNEQRAQMSAAFGQVFPKAMQDAGVTTAVKSFATPVNYESQDMTAWLSAKPAGAHVLIVTPAGGRVFCTGGPCNFRFGALMRLFTPGKPELVWSALLEQPTLTPGMKIGRQADYEHYAREMARVLLQDTTARPRP